MDTNLKHAPEVRKGAIRWLIRETLGNLILIGILFGVVGRWDWPMGWALSAIYIIWSVSCAILILPVNPAMLAERARPSKDIRKWDMLLLSSMGLLMMVEYVVASMDVKFGWSPEFPVTIKIVSTVIAAFGYDILLVWSMASNAFFVATVRIQNDRGHSVVTSGPYQYLRHPGYLGSILLDLMVPFMLNSLWAIIPGVLSALILVVRTAMEDKTLIEELPGYKEYAERVRYRLIPGIW